ncbi:hypothetical protein SARC_15828, partial [Sphaeroforma arctica JP610]
METYGTYQELSVDSVTEAFNALEEGAADRNTTFTSIRAQLIRYHRLYVQRDEEA